MDQFCEKQQYSFLDYISSESKLNFMVAVDFIGKLFHILFLFYMCGFFWFAFSSV